VDSIVQFAQTNFDWDVSKTKSKLAPVLKKVSERTVSLLNILITVNSCYVKSQGEQEKVCDIKSY